MPKLIEISYNIASAVLGAAVGTVVPIPGVGTVLGGVIGGAVGVGQAILKDLLGF